MPQLALIALVMFQTPAAPTAELLRASKSPEALARFVDSHSEFDWRHLLQAVGLNEYVMGRCQERPRACSAELITVFNPDQSIVLIRSAELDLYIRYLKLPSGAWRVSGAHEVHIYNHPRRHEVDRSSGVPYLKVSSQGVRGSGVDSEVESWFDLRRPDFKPVFVYTVSGHNGRHGFGIGRNLDASASLDKNSIDLVVGIEFHLSDHTLLSKEYRLIYRPSPNTGVFELTSENAETKALMDMDEGASNETLIRMTLDPLKAIATGDRTPQKDQLRNILNRAKDTPEVRQLKALLARAK